MLLKQSPFLKLFAAALAGMVLYCSCAGTGNKPESVEWEVASLNSIQSVEGTPEITATQTGQVVSFDGKGDAFFVADNPLRGLEEFTLEVIFRPSADAPFAQRFLHIGQVSGSRVLFETRVTPENKWYFDAHTSIEGGGKLTLIDTTLLHNTGEWYNVALVWRKDGAASYINGVKQCEGSQNFLPITGDITSIGVRQNKVDWFKGDMYKIRVTAAALDPSQFLSDYKDLNTQTE